MREWFCTGACLEIWMIQKLRPSPWHCLYCNPFLALLDMLVPRWIQDFQVKWSDRNCVPFRCERQPYVEHMMELSADPPSFHSCLSGHFGCFVRHVPKPHCELRQQLQLLQGQGGHERIFFTDPRKAHHAILRSASPLALGAGRPKENEPQAWRLCFKIHLKFNIAAIAPFPKGK